MSSGNEWSLLAKADEISALPIYRLTTIFDINTSDPIKNTLKKLLLLQDKYHPDKSEQRGLNTTEKEAYNKIFRRVTELKKQISDDNSYASLIPPPTYTLDLSILDNDEIPSDNKDFTTALLVHPKILSLSLSVFKALKQKYPGIFDNVYYKSYYFNMIVASIAINVTLSFFNDKYDIVSLQKQILDFIEKSEMVDDSTYKLHDIIDLQGFDRQQLGNDYCLALNIFYSFMSTFFRDKIKVPSNFFSKASSSFYTHKEKCINPSYSPKPAKGSNEVTTTRDDFSKKNKNFTEFQKILKTELFEEQAHDDETNESLSLVPYVASAGSKSRRRHRHRRKPARKTRRGRTRKSKTKSKTHRRKRSSCIRKHKKYTSRRRR